MAPGAEGFLYSSISLSFASSEVIPPAEAGGVFLTGEFDGVGDGLVKFPNASFAIVALKWSLLL
jgi:hypothetical protein